MNDHLTLFIIKTRAYEELIEGVIHKTIIKNDFVIVGHRRLVENEAQSSVMIAWKKENASVDGHKLKIHFAEMFKESPGMFHASDPSPGEAFKEVMFWHRERNIPITVDFTLLMKKEELPNSTLVLCGHSCVGKTTIMKRLIEKYPNKFGFAVSVTTRKMREGEVEGIEYRFLDKEQFIEMQEKNDFIESAEYAGNYYGLPYESIIKVREKGLIPITILNTDGIDAIDTYFNKYFIGAKILIVFSKLSDIVSRLRERCSDEADYQNRLDAIKDEGEFYEKNKHMFLSSIKNEAGDLESAIKQIEAIDELFGEIKQ